MLPHAGARVSRVPFISALDCADLSHVLIISPLHPFCPLYILCMQK
jgi:hypothetical protein